MTSSHGLLGVSVAVCCSSTGLWLMTHLFIHGVASSASKFAAMDDCFPPHRHQEAAHLVALSTVCLCHDVRLAVYMPCLVAKVLLYHGAVRAFSVCESARVGDVSADRCLILRLVGVYSTLFGCPFGLQWLSRKQFKESAKLISWFMFPATLVSGLVVGSTVESVIGAMRCNNEVLRSNTIKKVNTLQ